MSNRVRTDASLAIAEALLALVRSEKVPSLTLRAFTAMLVLSWEGPMLMADLTRRLGTQKTTAWRMVKTLAEQELVTWRALTEENDKRTRGLVELSPNGAKLVAPFAYRLYS